jgi:hypothetical protein
MEATFGNDSGEIPIASAKLRLSYLRVATGRSNVKLPLQDCLMRQ